jgi:hypothetical protein
MLGNTEIHIIKLVINVEEIRLSTAILGNQIPWDFGKLLRKAMGAQSFVKKIEIIN